jgi:hypothetical protein
MWDIGGGECDLFDRADIFKLVVFLSMNPMNFDNKKNFDILLSFRQFKYNYIKNYYTNLLKF